MGSDGLRGWTDCGLLRELYFGPSGPFSSLMKLSILKSVQRRFLASITQHDKALALCCVIVPCERRVHLKCWEKKAKNCLTLHCENAFFFSSVGEDEREFL